MRTLLTALLVPIGLAPEIRAQDAPKPASPAIEAGAYRQVEVLMRAMETIRENYVDEDKVGYAELIEGALEGMFGRLDRHSQYMNPRLFEEVRKTTSNPINTSGIFLGGEVGKVRVVSLRDQGPAARAGLRIGDLMLAVDGNTLGQRTPLEAAAMLDGKPGQLLTVEIERGAPGSTRTIGFAREAPVTESVVGAHLLEKAGTGGRKIGYVRITGFREPTARELAKALDALEGDGMQALVLDLRGNPGGLLEPAIELCAEFLPPETAVASSRARADSEHNEEFRTLKSDRSAREYPLAVLIDGESASSAEIVAGALRDHKRATLVGTTSFGKGSIQTVMPMGLETGAAMRLTTARLFTAKGKPIDGVGIQPDIEIPKDTDAIAAAARSLSNKR